MKVKCSLCGSPNVNKSSCPLNPTANNPKNESHPYSCDSIWCADKRVEILGKGTFEEVMGYACRLRLKQIKTTKGQNKK